MSEAPLAIGESRYSGSCGIRPALSSRSSSHTMSCVRPIANDGMSSTPFLRTTSLTTSASMSIATSAAWCSRPPYVDSQTTKSASPTIVGSRRIGVPGRPRSPENTITVSRPPSGRVSRMRTSAEPRMCPASRSVTWTPWAASYEVSYGIGRNSDSVRSTSSSV